MSTKEKYGSVYSAIVNNMCEAADTSLKMQQAAGQRWNGVWPWSSRLQKIWLCPFFKIQKQWTDIIGSLAKSQCDAMDQQFGTAIQSFEALADIIPKARGSYGQFADERSTTVVDRFQESMPITGPKKYKEAGRLRPGDAMNIAQKVAVVTGAASGIGAAVARDLAQRGAKTVVLVDLNEEVHELANSINESFDQDVAEAVVGDTSDAVFRTQVFDDATARHGLVSICVPAAGITRDALSVQVDKETGKASVYPIENFRLVTEVNLIAPIYWAMEMVARIAEDRRRRGLKRWEPEEGMEGVVIFLGSVSSQGNKGQISYAVAKSGLEGAASTLMKEAIFHGVRCAIIHPGFTDTPMARALGEEYLKNKVLPYTQLRRLIRPEEIADAICFMISNAAVSGELWVDAGWHPQA